MRPMQLEFPDDPAVAYLDRQYMLGARLLVAPVFTAIGRGGVLPAGGHVDEPGGPARWCAGGGWRARSHGFDSVPLYVREGAVLPWGARVDRPDYDYLDGLTAAGVRRRDGRHRGHRHDARRPLGAIHRRSRRT